MDVAHCLGQELAEHHNLQFDQVRYILTPLLEQGRDMTTPQGWRACSQIVAPDADAPFQPTVH